MQNIDQKNLMVTQANQVALASYSLSLEEKRLILFLTSLIEQNDKDFKVYRIPITEIMDFLDIKGKAFYTRLRKIAKTLRSRPLSIEKPNGGWIETGWVSKAEYKPKGEDGLEYACLDLRFDPDMKPYLLQLKSQFFSYMLENVANLKSIYSIRFYEIFASYRRLGKVTFEIKELKKRLEVVDKYKRHDDFRKRIINTAKKELKEKTDIYFEYTEERQRRRVARIHFTIHSQANPQALNKQIPQPPNQPKEPTKKPTPQQEPQTQLSPEQQEANKILERNGVDQAGRERLIKSYDPKHIIENANIVLEKHKDGKVNNLAGATIKSIQEDWQPKLSLYEKKEEAKKQTIIKANKEKEKQKEQIEKLEQEFDSIKKEKLKKIKKSMTETEKEETFTRFGKSIESPILHNIYKKDGLKNAGVRISFDIFLSEEFLKPEEHDFSEWTRVNKNLKIKRNQFNEYEIIK